MSRNSRRFFHFYVYILVSVLLISTRKDCSFKGLHLVINFKKSIFSFKGFIIWTTLLCWNRRFCASKKKNISYYNKKIYYFSSSAFFKSVTTITRNYWIDSFLIVSAFFFYNYVVFERRIIPPPLFCFFIHF